MQGPSNDSQSSLPFSGEKKPSQEGRTQKGEKTLDLTWAKDMLQMAPQSSFIKPKFKNKIIKNSKMMATEN